MEQRKPLTETERELILEEKIRVYGHKVNGKFVGPSMSESSAGIVYSATPFSERRIFPRKNPNLAYN